MSENHEEIFIGGKHRKITKIQHTKDHKMFKLFSWNRQIDKAHLQRLVDSIGSSNLINLNPILVTETHHILDGQHRWAALKMLDLQVAYIVMPGLSEEDELEIVIALNSNKKAWGPKDFTSMYESFDNDNYKKLHAFAELHKIPFDSAKRLCSKVQCREEDFKLGKYTFDNGAFADKVMAIVNELAVYDKKARLNKSIMGVSLLIRIEGFNKEIFLKRLATYHKRLHTGASSEDYAQMFVERIYNFHTDASDSIVLDMRKLRAEANKKRGENV